jgi:hypothetical protein
VLSKCVYSNDKFHSSFSQFYIKTEEGQEDKIAERQRDSECRLTKDKA